jgi:hypothetical protein
MKNRKILKEMGNYSNFSVGTRLPGARPIQESPKQCFRYFTTTAFRRRFGIRIRKTREDHG